LAKINWRSKALKILSTWQRNKTSMAWVTLHSLKEKPAPTIITPCGKALAPARTADALSYLKSVSERIIYP